MSVPSSTPDTRRLRRGAFALAGAVALALAFAACDKSSSPTTPGGETAFDSLNPCGGSYAGLCNLRDTGMVVFENCQGCHNSDGRGSAGGVPPLAYSDFFMNNKHKTVRIVLGSWDDSLYVNGMWYQGHMPAHSEFSNKAIAAVLNYLRMVRNDSLIVSCDTTRINDDGFPICSKTPRSLASIYSDTVSIAYVQLVRDSLIIEGKISP